MLGGKQLGGKQGALRLYAPVLGGRSAQKAFLALFLLVFFSHYAFALTAILYTNQSGTQDGYVDFFTGAGVYTRDNTSAFMKIGAAMAVSTDRGFLDFNTTTIPSTATISNVSLTVNVTTAMNCQNANNTNFNWLAVSANNNTNSTAGNTNLYNYINNGSLYITINSFNNSGQVTFGLGSAAITNFSNQLSAGWFSVGITGPEGTCGATATQGQLSTTESSPASSRPYLTVTYTTSTPNVTVNMTAINSPANQFNSSSQSITFNVTPTDGSVQAQNLSIFTNATGTWLLNVTNSSLPSTNNNTPLIATINNLPANVSFIWNAQVCDTNDNCSFYNTNQTAIVDLTAPNVTAINGLSNNANLSVQNFTFNVTVTDNVYLQNVSLYTNSTGTWARNITNSSLNANYNNTPILLYPRTRNYGFNNSALAGWWDLGEESAFLDGVNKTPDFSGNGNVGTLRNLTGTSTPTLNTTNCVIGNCLSFAPGNFINGSITIDLTKNLTIAGWIYFKDFLGMAANSRLIELSDGSYSVQVLRDSTSGNWLTKTSYWEGSSDAMKWSNASTTGVWQHVVAVFDNSANKTYFYLNGTAQTNTSCTGCVGVGNQVNTFYIGARSDLQTTTFVSGNIDDVKIWKRALSASEVAALYNAGNPTNSTGQEGNATITLLPANKNFLWNVEACDAAGNCQQYNANQTAIVDLTAPNVTSENSPANSATITASVTFNITPTDNIQLANVSIFENNTGTWLLNATNSSINANNNNTPILVTVSNLATANATTWLGQACDVAGNCAFYNANRTLTASAASTGPTVSSINAPANNLNSSSQTVKFAVNATDGSAQAANVSIFTNATGTWLLNTTNSSLPATNNNTFLNVTLNNLPANASFLWNAQVCDTNDNCAFFSSNQTLAVELTPPNVTAVNTANFLNASSQSITFNVTATDALQGGLANVSIFGNFTNGTGVWQLNATNSSIGGFNNTPLLVTVNNIPANVSFPWTAQACNVAGFCAFYNSNQTAIVDLTAPNVSKVNSPSNFLNSSSQSITFNVTAADNVQLANLSVFFNATGTWLLNATNSSLNANTNNTPILVTASNIPANKTFFWNVQACDVAGNCQFYNANQTAIVELTPPNFAKINTASNLNSSSQSITFNITFTDAAPGGLANVSIFGNFTNGTGVWQLNASNTSIAFSNNTPVIITVNNIPANVSFPWNMQACNFAGNCQQYGTNQTAVVELTPPNITKVNTANFLNSSSQTITFNVTAIDAVAGGLANVSIFGNFTNGTGVWQLNATNSSIGAFNNTPILVTVNNIPANVSFPWNGQACNFAGYCQLFNANQTAIVELTPPNVTSENSPANNAVTNSSVTFNVTVIDAVPGGIANVSIFENNTGVWVLNATNSSLVGANNTPILVTVNSLALSNVTIWAAQACNFAGYCAFYNANRTLSRTFGPSVTSENSPANNLNSSSQNVTFNITATDGSVQATNVSIFTNATGTWVLNATNSSLPATNNNTPLLVVINNLPANASFLWVAQVCDTNSNCSFYGSNQTLAVEVTPPLISAINTAANLNASGQTITFNVTVVGALQGGIANVSIFGNFTNGTGVWQLNATNSTLKGANNTPILVTVNNIPANVSFPWNAQACNVAGYCQFFSTNQTAIVDLTGPNITSENSPVNNYNSTSQSITFNVTAFDNVQLANVSIFFNATGTWLLNATNSSLSAINNNTPILVTATQVPQNNQTTWVAQACDVAGNCAFYNANRTFIVNLTTVPTVTLNDPSTSSNITVSTVVFNFTPTAANGFLNATLFSNFSGSWASNNSNTTTITVQKSNITVNGIPDGLFVWNVQICDNNNVCSQSASNFTFRKDTAVPSVSFNSPADNLNASSPNVTFNVTVSDSFAIQNVSFYTNATGAWALNVTNSSVPNASAVTFSISNLPQNNRSIWGVQACDQIGNCAFTSSNRSFIVDLTAPNVTAENSPSNNFNSTSQSITFNVTATDNIQLANLSIFTNATGTWLLNSTNSSLNANTNNTPILVTVNNLPQNTVAVWNAQVCDVAGNCAFYNANRTFVVVLSSPNVSAENTPSNNFNSSSQSITFNITAFDGYLLANASIFTNATGTWLLNSTNSSIGLANNNSAILVTINNLPANVSFIWISRACNTAGLCAFYNANRSAIVDLTPPNVTKVNTASNLNSSSQSITFNVTVSDAVAGGLANVSIFGNFTNGTGVWQLNATNSSIGAFNNTPILVTVNNIPANVSFPWNAQACNFAGYCQFYNANQTAIADLTAPNISKVNSPSNFLNSSSQSITFNVTAADNVQLANLSIFFNATGTWLLNATNSSLNANTNNTPILVTIGSIPANTSFVWNAQACDVAGNCQFYNANQTAVVELTPPNVTKVNTANFLNSSSQSITFNVTAIDAVAGGLANVSIFGNFTNGTGVWQLNATNSSIGAFNNTPILVTVNNIPANVSFPWNAQTCNFAGYCQLYNANQTAVIELTPPNITKINTANFLNSSSQSIAFNVTVIDAVAGGLANVSIFGNFTNGTGVWQLNTTNSSIGAFNNTPILVTVNNIPANVSFPWTAQACNVAGFCAFFNANQTAIVDLTGPNITSENSPVNNFNSTSQSITFNVTASDNVQLANVSIFLNATGTWLLNATNGSLNAAFNNTPILVTINQLPANNQTTWVAQACDVAGNCAFYNANRTFKVIGSSFPVVSLNDPSSGTSTTATQIVFNFTPVTSTGFANASLYGNFSGSWAFNSLNSSAVSNNSKNSFSSVSLSSGYYVWNVLLCGSDANCTLALSNFSLTITSASPTPTPSGGGGGGGGSAPISSGGGGFVTLQTPTPSPTASPSSSGATPSQAPSSSSGATPAPQPTPQAPPSQQSSLTVGEGAPLDFAVLKSNAATESLKITNSEQSAQQFLLSLEGDAAQVSQLAQSQVSIPANSVSQLNFLVNPSAAGKPGVYTGFVIVRTLSGEIVYRAPLKVTILQQGQKLVTVTLSTYNFSTVGGGAIDLGVLLANQGDRLPFNVTLSADLVSSSLQSTQLLSQTYMMQDKLFIQKRVPIPISTAPGNYSLNVEALYFDPANSAWQTASASGRVSIENGANNLSAFGGLFLLVLLAVVILAAILIHGKKLLRTVRSAQPPRPPQLHALPLPRFSLPRLSLKLPRVSLRAPSLRLPRFSLPVLSLPKLRLPTLSIGAISLPKPASQLPQSKEPAVPRPLKELGSGQYDQVPAAPAQARHDIAAGERASFNQVAVKQESPRAGGAADLEQKQATRQWLARGLLEKSDVFSIPDEQTRAVANELLKKLERLVSDARMMKLDEKVLSDADELLKVSRQCNEQGDFRQSIAWSRKARQMLLGNLL